jgi:hypothetical protein
MNQKRSTYHSYLLRLWQETGDDPQMWRASLEDVQTRERHCFVRFEELVRFLLSQMSTGDVNVLQEEYNHEQQGNEKSVDST